MYEKFEITFKTWHGDIKYIDFVVSDNDQDKFSTVKKFISENPNYVCVHIKKIICPGCIDNMANQLAHMEGPNGCLFF